MAALAHQCFDIELSVDAIQELEEGTGKLGILLKRQLLLQRLDELVRFY